MKRPNARTGFARAGALVLLMVLAACGNGDTTTASETETPTGVEVAEVTVEGGGLSPFDAATEPSHDPAVGRPAPVLTGRSFDGSEIIVGAPGQATIVVFLAHWCPHCQSEVPVIVEWLAGGGLPPGIEMTAVATASDPERDNWPPSAWLEREGLEVPVLLDNAASDGAAAYGLASFPYFVVIDADGRVVTRGGGELGPAELDLLAASVAGQ